MELAKNEQNITDIVTDFNDFKECDVIFLCTPVGFIPVYAKKLSNIVKEDCVITDIGSTKRNIVEELKDLKIKFCLEHIQWLVQKGLDIILHTTYFLKILIIF